MAPIESRSAVASTREGGIELGIEGNIAVAGFSITTAPPAFFTCQTPAEPSEPLPVRITAMSPGPKTLAALSKSTSMEGATAPALAA